jgi:hypothetical protein
MNSSSLQLDLALDSVSRLDSQARVNSALRHDSLPRTKARGEPFSDEPASAGVLHLTVPLSRVPVDFFADPDGSWDFEGLVARAGFQQELGEVAIGALTEAFAGFPPGAAVVCVSAGHHISVALVDCTRVRPGERTSADVSSSGSVQ